MKQVIQRVKLLTQLTKEGVASNWAFLLCVSTIERCYYLTLIWVYKMSEREQDNFVEVKIGEWLNLRFKSVNSVVIAIISIMTMFVVFYRN